MGRKSKSKSDSTDKKTAMFDDDKNLCDWGFKDNICHNCGKKNSEVSGLLMQCGRCKNAYYCSRQCFNDGLPAHGKICSTMETLVRQPELFKGPDTTVVTAPTCKQGTSWDNAIDQTKSPTKGKDSKVNNLKKLDTSPQAENSDSSSYLHYKTSSKIDTTSKQMDDENESKDGVPPSNNMVEFKKQKKEKGLKSKKNKKDKKKAKEIKSISDNQAPDLKSTAYDIEDKEMDRSIVSDRSPVSSEKNDDSLSLENNNNGHKDENQNDTSKEYSSKIDDVNTMVYMKNSNDSEDLICEGVQGLQACNLDGQIDNEKYEETVEENNSHVEKFAQNENFVLEGPNVAYGALLKIGDTLEDAQKNIFIDKLELDQADVRCNENNRNKFESIDLGEDEIKVTENDATKSDRVSFCSMKTAPPLPETSPGTFSTLVDKHRNYSSENQDHCDEGSIHDDKSQSQDNKGKIVDSLDIISTKSVQWKIPTQTINDCNKIKTTYNWEGNEKTEYACIPTCQWCGIDNPLKPDKFFIEQNVRLRPTPETMKAEYGWEKPEWTIRSHLKQNSSLTETGVSCKINEERKHKSCKNFEDCSNVESPDVNYDHDDMFSRNENANACKRCGIYNPLKSFSGRIEANTNLRHVQTKSKVEYGWTKPEWTVKSKVFNPNKAGSVKSDSEKANCSQDNFLVNPTEPEISDNDLSRKSTMSSNGDFSKSNEVILKSLPRYDMLSKSAHEVRWMIHQSPPRYGYTRNGLRRCHEGRVHKISDRQNCEDKVSDVSKSNILINDSSHEVSLLPAHASANEKYSGEHSTCVNIGSTSQNSQKKHNCMQEERLDDMQALPRTDQIDCFQSHKVIEAIKRREVEFTRKDIGWEKPEWTKSRSLRFTNQGEALKTKGDLHVPPRPQILLESGKVQWEKPEWVSRARLRKVASHDDMIGM